MMRAHRMPITLTQLTLVAPWLIAAISVVSGCAPKDAQVQDVVRPVVADDVTTSQPATTVHAAAPGAMRETRQSVDPQGLLDQSFQAAEGVETSRMAFHRQERLGLFKSLQPAERMIALCRERPFSVLFTWLDDDSEFSQCVFIEGANDGAVLLHRRKGLFGGEGGVVAFPPELGVVFQKAKLPITDFGLRRVMAALRARIEAADTWGGAQKVYVGRVIVGPANELCDHLTLRFPDEDAHAAKRVELYLHAATHLPVMIELWLPDRGGDPTSALDARYIFAESEINPALTDTDFRLDAEKANNN
ncbi:MAG TPA: DUF1571 domain-containing protein [Phycisphaerae bacterium]|nr:DUF1571 domain-containing protein [Phycisphaerae bacterium]HRW55395.1 DUF1571 domain-containing protein [Phycisphaerae bacterium]